MALRDVIGQDRAIGILLRTLSRDRIPSAYLFSGEAGIGKKFAAVNLAKAINCLRDRNALSMTHDEINGDANYMSEFDACDKCPSCKKINAGTHPDFVMITPEKGEIRVGEIRAVEESLSLKPYEGRKKVFVIDDADCMNQSAANAFLKTLEEPPDESLLILVAAHPDRLPETVRSRCSRVSFVPLSPSSCEKVIMAVTDLRPDLRGRKRSEDDAGLLPVLVSLSMGRPGLAVSSDRLEERERFIFLLQNMLDGHGETWADREEMEQWLDMMFLLMRDMAILKIEEEALGRKTASGISAGDKRTLLNADMRDLISAMSKTAELGSITETYRRMVLLKKRLAFNLNKTITWNYVSSMMQSLKLNSPNRQLNRAC